MYDERRQPSLCSASPMIDSDWPLRVDLGVVEKFTPASYAAAMHSRAVDADSWLP